MERAVNFNAGPAAIPLEVLKEAQGELLDWKATGMSVMEVSHRSKEYEALHNEAQERFRGPNGRAFFSPVALRGSFSCCP
jgi:phosphoserine aminotransferase